MLRTLRQRYPALLALLAQLVSAARLVAAGRVHLPGARPAGKRAGAWLVSNSFEAPGIPAQRVVELDDWRASRLLIWQPAAPWRGAFATLRGIPQECPCMQSPKNLIWIDLEMTGLDPDRDVIIEMATIITDSELNVLAEGPVIAVHQSDEVLAGMDEWNTRQHGGSGLTQRVRDSRIDTAEAEAQTLAFIEQWVPKRASPICGNSICQDRRFLYRQMPALEAYFHYRNLDVSTLKELAARWAPNVRDGVKKTSSHLALDDIRDSIAELRHYREHFIKY